jgi:hypothetical protein
MVFTVSCDVQEINHTVPSTQAKFSYTISNNSIAPARAVFINQSINAQGYLWKFGNGDTLHTLSSDSVIYTYEQAGTYTIRLEVEPTTPDLYYNNLVAEKTIVINDIPVKRLYFADRNEGKVKYVVLDNNLLPVIEEFESATLNKPYGMDMDTLTGKLYVTDYAEQLLNRFDWDGQRQEILMNSNSELFNSPIGIAVIGNKIYWGEPGGIHRADLDGLNPEIFLDMPNEYPQDIAYDPLNQAIYFTNNLNPESGGVWRVDVDGTNLTNVVKDVWGGAIEVLPDSNYVYYYAAYEGMYIAELNGDNPRLFDASNAGKWAWGMAVDKEEGKIYYPNRVDGTIMKADANGSNVEIFIPAEADITPNAMTIDKAR